MDEIQKALSKHKTISIELYRDACFLIDCGYDINKILAEVKRIDERDGFKKRDK